MKFIVSADENNINIKKYSFIHCNVIKKCRVSSYLYLILRFIINNIFFVLLCFKRIKYKS